MSTDYTLEDTLHIAFTTRTFATGVPTVLAGTPVVSAYEDAGLTQITAGITLGVDHDGVVGLNMLTIAATAADGYEAGKDYNLVITTGTVGGVSVVGEVVGKFTIGRSAAAVDLANGTDGLGALKTLLDAIPTTAMRGTDSAALASVATEARLAELDAANIPTDVDAILVDTSTTLDGKLPAALVGGRMDSNVSALNNVNASAVALERSASTIVTGAAEAGTLSTTQMTTDLTEATDDHYNGRVVIWTSGVLSGQASDITDYTGSTGMLTYTGATEAPSAADTFVIV